MFCRVVEAPHALALPLSLAHGRNRGAADEHWDRHISVRQRGSTLSVKKGEKEGRMKGVDGTQIFLSLSLRRPPPEKSHNPA